MSDVKVPSPTLRRLPKYLNYLRRLQELGEVAISASTMSRDLDIQHTQVRKDLAVTGVQGVPKVGHKIDILIDAIEKFLDWNTLTPAVIVGAGNLGSALLGYRAFQRSGLSIVEAFDLNQDKIGQKLHDVTVYHIDDLVNHVKAKQIPIGIITVSAKAAQNVANLLVDAGIQAIWNFSHEKLNVPPSVIVEDVELDSSLAELSYHLKQRH